MALADHIAPSEEVQYNSDKTFDYGGDDYHIYVTDQRFVLYMERGLIRSKDDVVSWNLDKIERSQYEERGTIKKKGVLRLELSNNQVIQVEGGAEAAKTANQNMMQFL